MPNDHLLPLVNEIFWEDLLPGTRFVTRRRSLLEADLAAFVNLAWLTEELFTNTNADDRAAMALSGRVVPGALIHAFAEGLVAPSFSPAGLAFLGAVIDVKGPSFVGDTIRVECEVIEQRMTRKPDRAPDRNPDRGLVRSRNTVVNQHGRTVMVYMPLRMMRLRGG